MNLRYEPTMAGTTISLIPIGVVRGSSCGDWFRRVTSVGGGDHWRLTTSGVLLGNELMTGFLDAGTNPLSSLTIASLQDLGYEVSFDAANQFSLPSLLDLAMMGVGAAPEVRRPCMFCSTGGGEAVVLPEEALID